MVSVNEKIYTVGSVCSGIEAASVAWLPLGFDFKWFSEIADFPVELLKNKYPFVPNLGDMTKISAMINEGIVATPDIICGGTPCQAFSLAGWKKGMEDDRGNLTMKFVDIVNANDRARIKKGLDSSIVFWENVEGVLTDKTNAFGCFVAALAGLEDVPSLSRWQSAGLIRGSKRNVAWRVLDAKYFGVPQQRRRLYLIAGGKDFSPESILFEEYMGAMQKFPSMPLSFYKEGSHFEVFREYTDCLYSAYGTKWNGNAAAYNGSLYVVQDGRIRRLTPLECERLMGFEDNYTKLTNVKRTNRYQAIGNSWAVPVIKWIGQKLHENFNGRLPRIQVIRSSEDGVIVDLKNGFNVSTQPVISNFSDMTSVVSKEGVDNELYISPTACYGIIRRKTERNLKINVRLEEILLRTASKWSMVDIEKRSRVQKRGAYSDSLGSVVYYYND